MNPIGEVDSIVYIILAILVFGILIFVHELGHFLAAKWLGVQVNEFANLYGSCHFSKENRRNDLLIAVHSHRRVLRNGRRG